MVHFRTLIELYRPYTGSAVSINFRSLLSVEFIVFDIGAKFPGWDIHSYMHYAQYEGKRYFWCGEGAPKEFVGDWRFMYETNTELAKDTL